MGSLRQLERIPTVRLLSSSSMFGFCCVPLLLLDFSIQSHLRPFSAFGWIVCHCLIVFATVAPEVMQSGHYNAAADVFSFGIVISEAVAATEAEDIVDETRTNEFGLDVPKLKALYCNNNNNNNNNNNDTMIVSSLIDLAGWCCQLDPSQRPTTDQIVGRLQRTQLEYQSKQLKQTSSSHGGSKHLPTSNSTVPPNDPNAVEALSGMSPPPPPPPQVPTVMPSNPKLPAHAVAAATTSLAETAEPIMNAAPTSSIVLEPGGGGSGEDYYDFDYDDDVTLVSDEDGSSSIEVVVVPSPAAAAAVRALANTPVLVVVDPQLQEEAAAQVFELVDQNQDGYLSYEETRLLSQVSEEYDLSPDAYQSICDMVGASPEQGLSQEQVVHMYTRLQIGDASADLQKLRQNAPSNDSKE